MNQRGPVVLLTVLLAVVIMAGMFLMLLAGVGLIQDKKLFTSAPKEVQEVIQPRKQQFPGARALGWALLIFGVALIIGAILIGAVDGIENHFSLQLFFARFLVMALLAKVFDVFFFDWVLLCHSNFYPHFYPETKDVIGPQLFGFNKKSTLCRRLA